MGKCEKVRESVRKCDRVWEKCEKVWGSQRKVWESERKCGNVWESV